MMRGCWSRSCWLDDLGLFFLSGERGKVDRAKEIRMHDTAFNLLTKPFRIHTWHQFCQVMGLTALRSVCKTSWTFPSQGSEAWPMCFGLLLAAKPRFCLRSSDDMSPRWLLTFCRLAVRICLLGAYLQPGIANGTVAPASQTTQQSPHTKMLASRTARHSQPSLLQMKVVFCARVQLRSILSS